MGDGRFSKLGRIFAIGGVHLQRLVATVYADGCDRAGETRAGTCIGEMDYAVSV